MYKFIEKRELKEIEKSEVVKLLDGNSDIYSDFYLTKNNIRLYIKENIDLLYDIVLKGDKLITTKYMIAVILGYSDNSPRKYLKILTNDITKIPELLETISWKIECNIFMKIKKNNPIREILINNRFEVIGGRGKEILLEKKI